jgi:hypothetical protein
MAQAKSRHYQLGSASTIKVRASPVNFFRSSNAFFTAGEE